MNERRDFQRQQGAGTVSLARSLVILVMALALSGAAFLAAPSQVARADAPPVVDGRLFGDGDIDRYALIAQEVAAPPRASLYARIEGGNLYVAVAYDRAGNDNVFDAGATPYMASADWNKGAAGRTAKRLTDSEYTEFTLNLCGQTWVWRQAYAYSDSNFSPYVADWHSDHLQAPGVGTAPPGIVSSSSLVWNLNNAASGATPRWDVTQGNSANAGREKWKSPYNAGAPNTVIGVDGYPATGAIGFDATHGWEWPMVYEFAVPLGQFAGCDNPAFSVAVTHSHNSPPKIGDQDVIIPPPPDPFWDFGDLPDVYGTTLAANGARHILVAGGAYLGARVDWEKDGQPNVGATGDDNNGADEEGVAFLTPLMPGFPALMQVTAGTAGYLSAFVDWNGSGALSPVTGLSDTHLAAGVHRFWVDVPANAGETVNARFRFTNQAGQGGASPLGEASTGEVEDYALTTTLPAALGDFVWAEIGPYDGLQSDMEREDAGFPGITVHLLDGAGNPVRDYAGQPITTVTDASGHYLFEGLAPGDYRVRFVPPVNYYFTAQNQGADEARDSDADPSGDVGLTGIVTLAPGDEYLALDAGLYYVAPSAVELISFEAQRVIYNVRVRWETASELDVVGYDVYRSTLADRIAMQGVPELTQALNPQLIASQSLGGVLGGSYEWVDETAALGETYVYFLAAHDRDGSVELYASNVVEPGKVVKFWMPMMWGGKN